MAWARKIWFGPTASGYWNAQSRFADTTMYNSGDDAVFGFSACQLVWTRLFASGASEDVAVCDFSFTVNPVAGTTSALDPATHMPNVEGDLNTWWTAVKPYIHSSHTLKEYRWYQYYSGTTGPGPAVRVTTVGLPGTSASNVLPLQTAATVSFHTPSRKHWGRIYLPGLVSSNLTTSGEWSTGQVDAIALAGKNLINNVSGHAWGQMVVASKAYHGVLSIDELAMDSSPDVQRRRREDRPNYVRRYTS